MPSPRNRRGHVVLRTLLAVVAMCASALLAGGCGEDAGAGGGQRALSKGEYIQRADTLQQEAADVFTTLDGRLPATPSEAVTRIAALDDLIAGYERLVPPGDWQEQHAVLLESLRTMRQSLNVVSKASANNRRAIEYQVGRYQAAQADFEQAVREINATR